MIKKLLVLVMTLCLVFTLAACGGSAKEDAGNTESEATAETPKEEQEGTAGSNIPLKDNQEEAKLQIKDAMMDLLEKSYGDKIDDVRVNVEKVYTTEDEQANDVLKEENLTPDDVAFEVSYELHPSKGTDVNELLPANGEYDKDSGWVVKKTGVGILRKADDGSYKVDSFGTGW